jgi:hypothetical protein
MNHPDTAIAETRRRAPSWPECEVLQASPTRASLEAAEWCVVRRGLGVMAWCLAAFLVGVLGILFFHARLVAASLGPAGKLLEFQSALFLPISGLGLVVGVVLSLLPPRRARLVGWIAVSLVALVVGIMLLVTAVFWRQMPARMGALTWSTGTRELVWGSLVALLTSHLAYCFYLAAVARRFEAKRLARCFVACFVALVLQAAFIALAEAAMVAWQQRWVPPIHARWREDLWLCAEVTLLTLGAVWVVLLWLLRQRLPREETSRAFEE